MSEPSQLISDKVKFELAWEALERLGIPKVEVPFDGSGDSGDLQPAAVIYDMALHDKDIGSLTPDQLLAAQQAAHARYEAQDATLQAAVVDLDEGSSIKLTKLIEDLSDTFATGYEDWWNDDGGYGQVVWYVKSGINSGGYEHAAHTISLEINVRIVSSEYYEHNLNRHGQETDTVSTA